MDHQVDFIEDQIDWKWCLLALSGNATIVKLRRNEFVKYLKMNVAAQTGSEYDFVRVTSIRLVLMVYFSVTYTYTPKSNSSYSLFIWNEKVWWPIPPKSYNMF